jgi:tetratricopeptide (TPR) repeat protein
MNSSRRRALLAIAAIIVLGGSAAAVWQFTRDPKAPSSTPPEVKPDGVDPSVVAALQSAREKVLGDPHSPAAWGEYGKLLLAHTFDKHADYCFREAEKLDPIDGRWPYYRGLFAAGRDPRAALDHFRTAVARRQPNTAYVSVARLRLAEAMLDQQDLGEAANLFGDELASETESSRARAACGLGLIAMCRDNLVAARQQFISAAASPFARQRAFAQLSRIARLQGSTDDANRYEDEATRPPPDRPWPDPFLAEANKLRVGQQKTLQEADALVRRGHPEEAARLLAELSRDYPNEQTYQATGALLIQIGDYAQAEQALKNCLAFDPTHPQAHHLLASAYFQHGESVWNKGERERAKELFRSAADHALRATERKPDFASAYIYQGRALLYLDQRDDAIASLRKAVECRPEIADGHLYLGEALAAAGKFDEARKSLEVAAQLAGPSDPRAKAALAKIKRRIDPVTGLDLGITDVDEKLEFIDVRKEDVRKIYVSFFTWYHGSDSKYHYLLQRIHDTVFRIARSEMSDEQLLAVYREKIARDRSKIPSPGAPHRSKEFLEWLNATKVERVAGIDKKDDY